MTNVYAWPPVGRTAFSWAPELPVNVSRSILTGARYVSGAQRKRRYATVTVSHAGLDAAGMGYLAVLRELLAGGIHLVRLNRVAPNGWADALGLAPSRRSTPLPLGTTGDADISLTSGGTSLTLFSGRVLRGVASVVSGQAQVAVSDAPPLMIIARPAEMLTLYSPITDTVGTSAMVQTIARSDADGAATVKLLTPLTGSGRVEIGTVESAVFEVTDMPADVQPLDGDWSVTWSFAEVFADEAGGFTEVNPW